MYLTIQIAVGIWLGGLFLFGTATVSFKLAEKIAHNKRYGAPVVARSPSKEFSLWK